MERVAALLLALPLLVSSCGEPPPAKPVVFVAASTADVVGSILADSGVRLSVGPSSALARQVRDGAPADVLVTASADWLEYLEEGEALVGTPLRLAGNSIVCVAPRGGALDQDGISGATELLAALGPGERVAIADEGVPVGEYARESLASTGELEPLQAHLVGQVDARDCLRAVQDGQVAAGFVYASDAKHPGVRVLFPLDPATHGPVEVWGVVTSSRPEADALLARLASEEEHEHWTEAGFRLAAEGP